MASEMIRKHLEQLKSKKSFDADFIDTLIQSNEKNEDGKTTAAGIIQLIEHKYAESKKHKA